MRFCRLLMLAIFGLAAGCGTSKWTDTRRSATEQLLISDSMDRAVSRLDFRALAGKTVYLDSAPLKSYTDSEYLVSLLRQHMLASGCLLRDTKNEADYIVEARAGAVGTDRHEVIFGVPAVNVPSMIPITGLPSQIPEMPLIKKTDCRAVTKLAVFAYNRETGRPVWQSGTIPVESTAKDIWVLGAGPFQRGTIYDGTNFAGDRLHIPLIDLRKDRDPEHVAVAEEAYFVEPGEGEQQLAVTDGDSSTGEARQGPEKEGKSQKTGKGEAGKSAESRSQVVPASHDSASQSGPARSAVAEKGEAEAAAATGGKAGTESAGRSGEPEPERRPPAPVSSSPLPPPVPAPVPAGAGTPPGSPSPFPLLRPISSLWPGRN